MRIKAVLFDLGDTLVTPWSLEASFERVLSSLKIKKPLGKVKEAFDKTGEDFEAGKHGLTYGQAQYREYWNAWSLSVLEYLGVRNSRDLVQEFESKWLNHPACRAYPDAKETLRRLRRLDLKTGLISTVYKEAVLAILSEAGLKTELFDVIIGADSFQKMKPHPEVFTYALAKLGISPQEALFIGDSVESDYRAAEKTGMKALLIRRASIDSRAIRGLTTISSLEEVFWFHLGLKN